MFHANPQMLSAPNRRFTWFRFSLRVGIAAITLLCIPLGIRMNKVQKQERAIRHYRELGGRVAQDRFHEIPVWFEPLVYVPIQGVWLDKSQVKSGDLRHLAAFPSLQRLDLTGVPVNSEDAQTLANLTELESLSLSRTGIGDAEARQLASLRRIRVLSLAQTNIGDKGFWYLRGLSEIRNLDIANSRITDDGLKLLQSFPKLNLLELDEQQITAKSIEHLKGLRLVRIRVRCRSRGREQRDLLARLGMKGIVGISDAQGFVLWLRASQPWEQSPAGVCETLERELQIPAQYSDQLLRLISLSAPDWERTFPKPIQPIPRSISMGQSQDEFFYAITGEVGGDEHDLWSLARFDRAELVVPEIVRRLDDSRPGMRRQRLFRFVSHMLGSTGLQDQTVVNVLRELLNNPDPSIRETTVNTFRRYFVARHRAFEIRLPEIADARVSVELLTAVVENNDTDARPTSHGAGLYADARWLAFCVVGSLGQYYPELAPSVLPALVSGLADEYPGYQESLVVDRVARSNSIVVKPLISMLLERISASPNAASTAQLIEALGAARHGSDEDANRAADVLLVYLRKPASDFVGQIPPRHYASAAYAMGLLSEQKTDIARRMLLEVLEQHAVQPDFEDRAKIAVAAIIAGVHRGTRRVR
jgi:hypothetical protein